MKVGRYLLYLVISGIIGGIIGGSMNSISTFLSTINFSNNRTALIICIIFSIIVLILTAYQWKTQHDAIKFKKSFLNSIEDDEADIYEKKANLKYNLTTIIAYTLMTVSFIAALLFVIGKNANFSMLFAIIPFMLTGLSSLMLGFFNRRFDSRYPKMGEKNYTEKTLDLMDEGERHITLISMYKNYQMNIVLLMIAIILLSLYSIDTGSSQSFSIFILIIIFVYNSLGYMLKVRKFYKS